VTESVEASIRFNPDFDSNDIDESLSHDEKHHEQSILTLRGITIDSNEDNGNVDNSIRFNIEFDSNEIDENDCHSAKHDKQRISTLRGITIDSSENVENADDSICCNSESDSNERMKVEKMKNIMNKEFQHFVESQLSEVNF
jgi:hypothetical protein